VILFTNKKTTPPLLKALSKDLKGKLIFGEVRSDNSPLIQKFKL
jgi:DnaJ family protein C protein 16